MSEKIGRRPSGPVRTAASKSSEATESGAGRPPAEVSTGRGQPVTDRFEKQPSGPAGAQLGNPVPSVSPRAAPGKIAFTNEDLAYLANTFVSLIRQHPKANRSKRAKMFTKAILKGHKKLGKLFEKLPQEESEKLFDTIGDALDQSPIFAQMVENVTDEASKLNG